MKMVKNTPSMIPMAYLVSCPVFRRLEHQEESLLTTSLSLTMLILGTSPFDVPTNNMKYFKP